MTRPRKYTFPVRDGNAFTLLVDGAQYYAAMLAGIQQARAFIFLEQYLVTTGTIGQQFSQALSRAVDRGVKVYCLLDDYGSRGLRADSRQALLDAGIQLAFYNPIRLRQWQIALFRDHRKLLLIDNTLGFVGGAGITDDFIGDTPDAGWHDIVLQIKGPVLLDWCQLFQNTWRQMTGIDIRLPETCTTHPTGHTRGQVLANFPWRQEFNRLLLNRMERATTRIWLATPYFVPVWKLRRRLRRMAKQGLDVRLLLPGDLSDHPWVSQAARRYYTHLLRHGVRIFEYEPRFTHVKLVLCDHWVSIGSINLDRWNQHWNLDANQAINEPAFAAATAEVFLADFAQSREIKLADWLRRPWWQRWHEGYAGYVVLLLEKLSRYRPQRRQ
ncbi:MAG: phosphatidylserine/phosphatidylglycerophosphate/cardiolipin synthase family protein [Gammaproteobacteria bacterium]